MERESVCLDEMVSFAGRRAKRVWERFGLEQVGVHLVHSEAAVREAVGASTREMIDERVMAFVATTIGSEEIMLGLGDLPRVVLLCGGA